MKFIIKLIEALIYVACILFLLWIAASFIDIVADNSWYNPQHSPYNFFYLMFQWIV